MDDAQFKQRIDQIHADLERYSYYELLNLAQNAGPDEIRAAFHRMAFSMHPDRYHTHPDAALRDKLYAVYKRLTEGYKVLSDSRLRREYDEGLARGQLRLLQLERRKTGPQQPAPASFENPQAKKFFDLALAAERRGDFKTARLNYKFASDLAGDDHPAIRERLELLERAGK
jgi:DnaJ-class molecular chaperone